MQSLPNESLLVDQMCAGSKDAFTELYRYYSPMLYINILQIVRDPLYAEEIVQELFIRVWQKRESKGMQENFAGYIIRIGQNLVHDFFRKMERDRKLLNRFRSLFEERYEPIQETLENQQSTALLKKAIAKLSPQQKRVYELVKVQGLTYKKAAEIMGISAHTVKEYLAATKKTIQQYMLNNMDENFSLLLFIAAYNILL